MQGDWRNWAQLDRRVAIQLGTAGLAALALPGAAQAAFAQGFTHGVASGEPSATSVLLWTRYAAASDTDLRFEVAEDAAFTAVVQGGQAPARAARDFCAKATATGLEPGRWYYYRFIAPSGAMSPVGRTRTLPADGVSRFTLALFSCSNLPFGHFNAYGHAAARQDIDLAVHVGDYLYEYPAGTYPDAAQALPGRDIQPSREIVTLADYRLRHAAYRADPDLQRLHQLFPMISHWDDHELTNDAWVGGAENHQPDSEGDWGVRKAAAMQAYHEWLPVSTAPWRDYHIGDLAHITLPETRISGRSQPFDIAAIARQAGGNPAAALKAFAEDGWRSADQQLLGAEQEAWLTGAIAASARRGTRWQICAQQVVMGSLFFPSEARGWFASAPAFVQERIGGAIMAAQAGLPLNMDAWDGYPAARARLLAAAQTADANLVVLSGDSHNGWAFNLEQDGARAGVEIATHSVTSPGFEAYTPGASEADRVRALRGSSPGLAWANTHQRGYTSIRITPDELVSEWHFMDTIRAKSLALAGSHRMRVRRGERRYDAA